jgi:hypothetical protein
MTMLHATAGYIFDVQQGAAPTPPSRRDRELLRTLAGRVAEVAGLPQQAEKRDLWYRHNRLQPVRPLVLVFPEDSWAEVLPADTLQLTEPFWRQQEWYLRHLLYRHEKLHDDFVIEPHLYVTKVFRGTGWGLSPGYRSPGRFKGAWQYDPPIKDPADIEKLTYPTIEYDAPATERALSAMNEMLGDLLEVRAHCPPWHANLIGEACALRGIEQFMLDMHDRPEWVHRLMGFLAEGVYRQVQYLEAQGHLTLNNGHHYNDSGGLGYTNGLPAPGFDGERVRPADLWGFGVAQEAVGIGPAQHEEFILNYQLRMLQRYGLNAYGCCEPYDTKFAMLDKVPRLRRVSVSCWCDIERSAEACRDRWVFSWKPNPAMVVGRFDPDRIRQHIRRTLEVTRGCTVELVHKDTFTIDHEPARLETWARIAREEIDRLWP